jgi:hypothetical protein
VTVRIDNNMDTVWDETFTFTTAIAGPGDLGVCGYNDALLDNWTAVAPGLAGPAVLEVSTIDTTPTTVLQGEAGIAVTMSVDNTGQDRATSVAGALTFTGSADRTAEYTVTPDPANPTEIQAGTTEVLQFTVDVSFSATTEVVTIDGGVTGLDAYAGGPLDDPDAAVTDSWEVLWACHATLCGDCNGDGQISIVDALTAAQHSAGLITLTGDDFTNCNVLGLLEPDPGAEVDILDALNLARSAAGLGVTLACC